MGDLIKIFFIVLILIFLVPMVWFLLKELLWLFDLSFSGDFGWFVLSLIFVGAVIKIFSD